MFQSRDHQDGRHRLAVHDPPQRRLRRATTRRATWSPAPGTRTSRRKFANRCCRAPACSSIASPGRSRTPGVYNGVLVARINTDVALTDFEIAVRDLMSNLENAYWDLYYGYRDLDAKVKARDEALKTWRSIYALYETGRTGGEADNEAQAREQYFRFQEDVQTALSGEILDGTRIGNGSGGGTFRPTGGVLVAERRLRLLMGLSPTDGRLIRPTDEPIMAKVDFDWEQVNGEAATRRAELRRQKWNIRRRELEADRQQELPDAAARRGRPLPLARLRRRSDRQRKRRVLGAIRQRLRQPDDRRFPGMATRLRAVAADRLPPGARRRAKRRAAAGPRSGPAARSAAGSDSRAVRLDCGNGPHVCRRPDELQPADRQPATASGAGRAV